MADLSPSLQRLFAIFERKSDDGSYYYSDAEVRHVIPLLVLAGGEAAHEVVQTPSLRRIMTEFMASLELDDRMSPEETGMAITKYYEANPPHPELMRALEDFGQLEGVSVDADKATAARKFIGDESKFDDSPPPEGAVRAGPLARFEMDDK